MDRDRADTHQGNDDLAVGMGLEFDIWADALSESDVVVNLAIDGQNDFAILAHEWLGPGV